MFQNLNQNVTRTLQWLRTLVTEPRHELTRWERAIRYSYELCLHGWKALSRDNAPQMAAALAYRTLFALLPVVIVSTVLLRAMQGIDQFNALGSSVIEAMGLKNIRIPHTTVAPKSAAEVKAEREAEKANPDNASPPASNPTTAATSGSQIEAGTADVETISLGEWLENLLRDAAKLDLAALGWAGLAVVIYSAIGLMVTVENAFNAIYGAPEGRYWVRRVPMYWMVLTLGPLFIVATLYVDRRFAAIIGHVHGWAWLLTVVKYTWGLCVTWLLMFSIYRLVPNTKVQNKAALIGSFIAAVLLTAGKFGLAAYFANAISFSKLYGTLGSIPLFMFWVYLMWLAVLFGLEVSATVQSLQGRHIEELEEKRPQNGLVDPVQVVNVMELITERFAAGLATSTREITDQTFIPENLVCLILDRLVREGVLHRVEGHETSVTLALPPDQVPAGRMLEVGYALVDEGGVGRVSPLVTRLREVQKRLVERATLASLLPAAVADGEPRKP